MSTGGSNRALPVLIWSEYRHHHRPERAGQDGVIARLFSRKQCGKNKRLPPMHAVIGICEKPLILDRKNYENTNSRWIGCVNRKFSRRSSGRFFTSFFMATNIIISYFILICVVKSSYHRKSIKLKKSKFTFDYMPCSFSVFFFVCLRWLNFRLLYLNRTFCKIMCG